METILHKFAQNASELGSATCFIVKNKGGVWVKISWRDVFDMVFSLASRLKLMGVQKGDFVAIMSNTRYEWTIIDLAILSLGAVTVPIYNNLSSDQVVYILNHSSSKILFVEDDKSFKLIEGLRSSMASLEKIVLIDGVDESQNVCCLRNLMDKGAGDGENFYEEMISQIQPGDLATCVYTSGTTGEPKGVMITHANIMGEVQGLSGVFSFGRDDIGLLFLPLAHVMARAFQFYQLSAGHINAYAEGVEKLPQNMLEVSPHFIVAVPRMIEKIYEKVMDAVSKASRFRRFMFDRGLRFGKAISSEVRKHKPLSAIEKIKYKLINKLVFEKLHKSLGGSLRMIVSGGAPLDKDVAEFLHAMGLSVIEGYGLTETIAAVTVNSPDDFKFGTVGKPIKDVQIRIADDGEVLLKGPQMFVGYFKDENSTHNAFIDGWFKTGDFGEFSRDGFLRICGRKKEIIITASGKNVAPQRVEGIMRTSPYIKDLFVYGDKRKYLCALVIVDCERIPQNIESSEMYELVRNEIECRNKELSRHETIKKFVIIDHAFSISTGELTPTMKVRRHKVYELYKGLIDGMYD